MGEELDDINDPIARLEENERQGPRAFAQVIVSLTVAFGSVFALATAYSLTQNRCPDNTPLCLSTNGWEFFLPIVLSIALSVRIGIKAYRHWKNYVRWRPWLFASYAMWVGTTAVLIMSLTLAAPGQDGVHPALDGR